MKPKHVPPVSPAGPVAVLTIFCFGLGSGFAGGLLLGGTEVLLVEALEQLLGDNQLMDQLTNYIVDIDVYSMTIKTINANAGRKNTIFVSFLVELFMVITSAGSLVGVILGISMYSIVIRRSGDTAKVTALTAAALVCVIGSTGAGCLAGSGLQRFLFVTSSPSIFTWFFMSKFCPWILLFILVFFIPCMSETVLLLLYYCTPLTLPITVYLVFVLSQTFKTNVILLVGLAPTVWAYVCSFFIIDHRFNSFPTASPLLLMPLISDGFSIASHRIVALPLANTTGATGSYVVEGCFVGVLVSHMLILCAASTLFDSWSTCDAGKVCGVAVASAVGLLPALKLLKPVLGAGCTIGALTGAVGAVGVSISAAGAAVQKYEDGTGFVGRLGVTVGAAIGAVVSSHAHSGLSQLFMGLLAAALPAGACCVQLHIWLQRCDKWPIFKLCCLLATGSTLFSLSVAWLLHSYMFPRAEIYDLFLMGLVFLGFPALCIVFKLNL